MRSVFPVMNRFSHSANVESSEEEEEGGLGGFEDW